MLPGAALEELDEKMMAEEGDVPASKEKTGEDLPEAVLRKIFQFVDIETQIKVFDSCDFFKPIMTSVWLSSKYVCFSSQLQNNFADLIDRFGGSDGTLEAVDFVELETQLADVQQAMSKQATIKEVGFYDVQFPVQENLYNLSTALDSLDGLTISVSGPSLIGRQLLTPNFVFAHSPPHLTRLQLARPIDYDAGSFAVPEQTLNDAFARLAPSLKALLLVGFLDDASVTGSQLAAAIAKLSELEELSLHFDSDIPERKINSGHMEEMVAGCSKLQFVCVAKGGLDEKAFAAFATMPCLEALMVIWNERSIDFFAFARRVAAFRKKQAAKRLQLPPTLCFVTEEQISLEAKAELFVAHVDAFGYGNDRRGFDWFAIPKPSPPFQAAVGQDECWDDIDETGASEAQSNGINPALNGGTEPADEAGNSAKEDVEKNAMENKPVETQSALNGTESVGTDGPMKEAGENGVDADGASAVIPQPWSEDRLSIGEITVRNRLHKFWCFRAYLFKGRSGINYGSEQNPFDLESSISGGGFNLEERLVEAGIHVPDDDDVEYDLYADDDDYDGDDGMDDEGGFPDDGYSYGPSDEEYDRDLN